jgi:hypothetical protein
MALSHSGRGGWTPPWQYNEEPHAVLIVRSSHDGPSVSWRPSSREGAREFVAQFLEARREGLDESELASDATFLYVVVRRAPKADDDRSMVATDTPVAEFGYGAPPASPDDWPLIELETLIRASISELRRGRSP